MIVVSQKEFVNLVEKNIMLVSKLAMRLKTHYKVFSRFPRQHLQILMRLHMHGRTRLKDIAVRECAPASNLCAVLRVLEKSGLVRREVDEADRRNILYSVTPAGAKLANRALKAFRNHMEALFAGISKNDEMELTDALKTINKLLTKIKEGS
jgi:DNA-binding MarR family transcriptional regulator